MRNRLQGFICFVRTLGTDFWTDLFALICCTDLMQGLNARIVCADFRTESWGVPNHLLGSAKIKPRKSPEEFTMFLAAFQGGAWEAGGWPT